jgi:hypothetical protein
MAQIKIIISAGKKPDMNYIQREIITDREVWDLLSEGEQWAFLSDKGRELLQEHFDFKYEIVEADDGGE